MCFLWSTVPSTSTRGHQTVELLVERIRWKSGKAGTYILVILLQNLVILPSEWCHILKAMDLLPSLSHPLFYLICCSEFASGLDLFLKCFLFPFCVISWCLFLNQIMAQPVFYLVNDDRKWQYLSELFLKIPAWPTLLQVSWLFIATPEWTSSY